MKNISKEQKQAEKLIEEIKVACIKYGLNLAIHDGKIGVVDQKIVK